MSQSPKHLVISNSENEKLSRLIMSGIDPRTFHMGNERSTI